MDAIRNQMREVPDRERTDECALIGMSYECPQDEYDQRERDQ
jgi:hypothetical protein